jgi:uncharacterized protein
MTAPARPHLPYSAPIEAYGRGGFRFADMSHRGSLLCLPDGIWAWPVVTPADINGTTLADVFARADAIDIFLIGCGRDPWPLPAALGGLFRDRAISADTMPTGAAISTYNILLGENRKVAAGLIAVG